MTAPTPITQFACHDDAVLALCLRLRRVAVLACSLRSIIVQPDLRASFRVAAASGEAFLPKPPEEESTMSRPSETFAGVRHEADPRLPASPVVAAGTSVIDDSAVSWAAILAGAAAAAALSLVLVLLGTGLGLSSVSPWAFEGVSTETFGWATIAWISFMSIAASALGGYLTGRLRRRWAGIPGDETYFRDTAHGFLAWGIATLLTATLLTSTIASMLGTGVRAGAAVAGSAAGTAAVAGGGMAAATDEDGDSRQGVLDYYVDQLFRGDAVRVATMAAPPPANTTGADDNADNAAQSVMPTDARAGRMNRMARPQRTARPEATRIIVNSLRTQSLDDADARYLGQLVADRTGLDTAQAQARVSQVHAGLVSTLDSMEAQARDIADEARKASAYAALWLFITLLMGAFTASLLATVGGRHRDF